MTFLITNGEIFSKLFPYVLLITIIFVNNRLALGSSNPAVTSVEATEALNNIVPDKQTLGSLRSDFTH